MVVRFAPMASRRRHGGDRSAPPRKVNEPTTVAHTPDGPSPRGWLLINIHPLTRH